MPNEIETDYEPTPSQPSRGFDLAQASVRLAESLGQEGKPRGDDARFAPVDETKVVDLKTGKRPVEEAPTDGDQEDFLELPAERDGEEPRRLKLTDVLSGFEEAQKLRSELEQARQPSIMPAEFERQVRETIQARSDYLQGAQRWMMLNQPQEPPRSLIDPGSAAYDPQRYGDLMRDYQAGREHFQQLEGHMRQEAAKHHAEVQAVHNAMWERETAKLKEFWPELLADTTVKGKVLEDTAKAYGFTSDEIASLADSRMFRVLRDALSFREQQASTEKTVKVLRGKPKLVKGGARSSGSPKAATGANALSRLQSTGSMDDAAAAILGLVHDSHH